nr:uncharacterized protein LOC123757665 [Procambarus clarkii]
MVFRVTNALVAGYRSFYHHADYLAIVLPDPAEHVNVEAPGATREVVVRWATPETLTQFPADLIYLLEYRLRQASSWSVGATGQCKSAKCWTSVEVEYWWQEYEVRVRLRSGAANFTLDDDGWWSDWSAVAVVTPPAEPEEAPAVGPGTFRIARNTPEYRDLTLSWRPLPTLLHNGPGFSYLVTATIYPGGASVATVNVTEPYATFTNLSTSLPYRLEVVSQNSEGRSQEGSWVVVGADNDLPDDPVLPVVVLHRQQQQYELRWHSSRRRAGDSYTLYVCVDGLMTSQPCQADLYWLTVGGVTAINITLEEFNLTEVEDTGVRFAVSTERETNVSSGVSWDTYSAVSSGMSWDTYSAVSSGMSWDRCSTPRAHTTAHRPPTLTSPVDVSETTARVQWTLECDDWAGVVEALEITYCLGHHNLSQDCHVAVHLMQMLLEKPSLCAGLCDVSGESAWESEVWSGVVEVRQLAAASQYTVWLRVSFRSGLSQWSSPQHFITDSGSPAVFTEWKLHVGTGSSGHDATERKLADTIEEVNRDIHLPEGLVSEFKNRCAALQNSKARKSMAAQQARKSMAAQQARKSMAAQQARKSMGQ